MAKKDANNKEKKEKKHYFKDFKAELKKVIWPTPKQLANNTVTVIVLVLITALIVFVLDFVFESMNTYGINKLKEQIQGNETTENTQVENPSDVTSGEAEINATAEPSNAVEENTTTENKAEEAENTTAANTAAE